MERTEGEPSPESKNCLRVFLNLPLCLEASANSSEVKLEIEGSVRTLIQKGSEEIVQSSKKAETPAVTASKARSK